MTHEFLSQPSFRALSMVLRFLRQKSQLSLKKLSSASFLLRWTQLGNRGAKWGASLCTYTSPSEWVSELTFQNSTTFQLHSAIPIVGDLVLVVVVLLVQLLLCLLIALIDLIAVEHFDRTGHLLGPESGALLNLLETGKQLLRGYGAGDGHLLLPLVASDSMNICTHIPKSEAKLGKAKPV